MNLIENNLKLKDTEKIGESVWRSILWSYNGNSLIYRCNVENFDKCIKIKKADFSKKSDFNLPNEVKNFI